MATNLNFLDGLLAADIDGIFLAYIKGKTWFNLLHVHGDKHLLFDQCLDYEVQAFNWEDYLGQSDTHRPVGIKDRSVGIKPASIWRLGVKKPLPHPLDKYPDF